MGISRRMGVAISGLAFAGATVVTLGTAGPASAQAQAPTVTPRHAVTSYSIVDRHRRWRHRAWRHRGWTYDYYWWGCGCGCC
ncbi:hypothetical protein OG417_30605 [Actinoallomurus sp. NBC_01490]|jgi:hypothetical protein|uniref:hypothetical protein n=1 Tax=Actinoallomurus sp. NBC_01490 TaxID=2903557 RepID=UPI002E32B83C|nr:hypothetical protein [Actinoallomurus sp. NBC_01490]